ncbi:MAG: hypothetical protein LBH98_06390 [Chitinispirillales bacterium]|nr:hypothetical protein [Chitinispirillales bacterium]
MVNSRLRTQPPAWRFEFTHISDDLFWHEAKVWLNHVEAIKFLARVDRDAFMLDGRRQYQATTSYQIEQEDGGVVSAIEAVIRVQEKLKLEQEEQTEIEELTAKVNGVKITVKRKMEEENV